MQAAVLADDLGAGPQHEVKRVAEQDLGARAGHVLGTHGLDRAIGADGHERGGLHHTTRKRERAAARVTVRLVQRELHVPDPSGQISMASP